MRTTVKKLPKAASEKTSSGLTASFFDKEEDRIANKDLFVKPKEVEKVQEEPMEGNLLNSNLRGVVSDSSASFSE